MHKQVIHELLQDAAYQHKSARFVDGRGRHPHHQFPSCTQGHSLYHSAGGDGILSHALFTQYSHVQGVLVDCSPVLLAAAKKRSNTNTRSEFSKPNVSHPQSVKALEHLEFDVMVSGYAIHHLHPNRKYEWYEEIYLTLAPGGMFLNFEQLPP